MSDKEYSRAERRKDRRVRELRAVYTARGLDGDAASDVAIELAIREVFGSYEIYLAEACRK